MTSIIEVLACALETSLLAEGDIATCTQPEPETDSAIGSGGRSTGEIVTYNTMSQFMGDLGKITASFVGGMSGDTSVTQRQWPSIHLYREEAVLCGAMQQAESGVGLVRRPAASEKSWIRAL
jgi:hypothetical protein